MTDNYTKIEGELEKEEEKTCTKCKEVKPFSEFHKRSAHPTGRAAHCKRCVSLKGGHTPMKKSFVDVDNEKRECTQCRTILPFSSFSRNRRDKYGRHSICKSCILSKKVYAKDKDIKVDLENELKECESCKKMLSFNCFNKDSRCPAGLKLSCNECSGHISKTDYIKEEKECASCKEVLPFSDFYKDTSHDDGMRSSCIICTRKSKGTSPRKVVVIDFEAKTKMCSRCNEILEFSNFAKNSNGVAGLSPACRSCCSIDKGHTPQKIMFLDVDKELKQCTYCEEILDFTEFNKCTNAKSGLNSKCRKCVKENRLNNLEKNRAMCRKSEAKHRDKRNAKKRKYQRENRVKLNAKEKEKVRTDPNFKMRKNLRSRGANAVRYGIKAGSFVSDLGCSLDYFHKYLEAKFYDRDDSSHTPMSWENQGFYGWHMDHIKPLISFDLTDREQFVEAAHYTNYQPLWAEHNQAKGDREDWSRW